MLPTGVVGDSSHTAYNLRWPHLLLLLLLFNYLVEQQQQQQQTRGSTTTIFPNHPPPLLRAHARTAQHIFAWRMRVLRAALPTYIYHI